MEVWVVGHVYDDVVVTPCEFISESNANVPEKVVEEVPKIAWELVGVYTTEQKAIEQCITVDHFVAPICLDETAPVERISWPGCYYPLMEQKP